MPRVTIIIPVLNGIKTITRTIRSVMNQSYTDFEVLVVDNGSNDGTIELLEKLVQTEERVEVLTSPKGRSNARNFGIAHARGKYIKFLDADDEISPDAILHGVKALETQPNAFAYACSTIYVDSNGQIIRSIPTSRSAITELAGVNPFSIHSVLIRNQDLTEFDPRLEMNEDWLFWANNLLGKDIVVDSSNFDAIVHVTGHNTMRDYDLMLYYMIYVRSRIKQIYNRPSLWIFKNDLRLASDFFLLRNCYSELSDISNIITRGPLRPQIIMLGILLKIPLIHSWVLKKYQQRKLNMQYIGDEDQL
ncbi:hypothetical protein BVG98_07450 [Lacticaseibacillus rhamnosus]|nr:hypothetical protein BVG98_07450 [Lacticaseibacillus rhamnosus]